MTETTRKRSGYDVSDWFADNPERDLDYLLSHLEEFQDPEYPEDMSTIQRAYVMDEIVNTAPTEQPGKTSTEKMAEINGRKPADKNIPETKDMFELTDLGNAEMFVREHGRDFLYTHQLGWFAWDGARWARDDGDLIVRKRAAETIRGIASYYGYIDDENTWKSIKKHAARSESSGRINAVPTIAQTYLSAKIESFDTQPMLINFQNGTLDLVTGEFGTHNRDHRVTQITNTNYNMDAKRDVWDKFIARVLPSEDLRNYVQDAIGYSLTGSVAEQCMFILFGTGSNGKSKFTDSIINAFGDYGKSVPSKLMSSGASDQHPTLLTELQWRRFASAQETRENGRLDEEMIKQLSGGDIISAHKMRKDYYDFAPTHKLWLSTNHKPTIRGTDHGIWRRMRMIPFTVTIPDEEKDKHLSDKLALEYDGILAWAVIGAMRWAARGLVLPSEVERATNEYRAEQDTIGQWIEDCVTPIEGMMASKKVVYDSYRQWCDDNGVYSLSQRKLTDRLTERGFSSVRTKATRMWEGISLLKSNEEEDDVFDSGNAQSLPF